MEDKTKNSSIRQKTHRSVDNMMDKAERFEEKGKEEMELLMRKAMMARENVDSYIKNNPEKSVLIAAGVGVAIGAILTALMMRRKH